MFKMVPSVLFLGFCLLLISKILAFEIHSFGYTPCLKCKGSCKKKNSQEEFMRVYTKGIFFREKPGEIVCMAQDKFFPNRLFTVVPEAVCPQRLGSDRL